MSEIGSRKISDIRIPISEVRCADIAQSVERIHGKDEVPGSIPGVGSTKKGESASPIECHVASVSELYVAMTR